MAAPVINPRVEAMRPSATLAMSARAKELRRAGRPVIELSAGEPDFGTPEPIRAAGIAAIEQGFTRYTANSGMPELRAAIADWLRGRYGLGYHAEQILCSNGAKQSVAQAILVAVCPGDQVLIPAPYWVSYPEMVRLAGGEPAIIETTPASGYRVSAGQLEAAITERTRLLILNSPANPTGAVYSRAQLEALAEVLDRHPHVLVLSDEIYSEVVYDAEHVAFAGLDGMFERTVTVNGFSKAYAMTGWRLGYLAGPRWLVQAAAKVQGQLTSAPSSISQRAGLAALRLDDGPVRQMVRAFRVRRDLVLAALRGIEGVVCPVPEGAFYAFPDVSAYFGRSTPVGERIAGAEALCTYLLEAHDVALVAGEAFGAPFGARISYAASTEDLRIGLQRIAAGLSQLAP